MNIPKLRFPEYTGEWEKKKLGVLVKFQQGIQIDIELQKKEEIDGYLKFLRIENYTQDSKDFRFVPTYLTNGKAITKKEIAIVRYGASAGFIARGFDGILANNLFKLIVDEKQFDNDYLYQYLKSESVYAFFQSAMAGGAMPALSFEIVKHLQLPFPSLSEQQRIASFFTVVDEKLQSLKKKKSLLEEYKKGVMQKLFSQELRFKDENGKDFHDWETFQLGQILIEDNEKTDKSNQ